MQQSNRELRAPFSKHVSWLSPLAIAAVAVFVMAASVPRKPRGALVALRGNPTTGGTYFIGNSMFGTGLDIDAVRRALPKEHSTLGYYDGCYTSMWYAAFRNSLIPSAVRPKVVIWGFRPTYAVSPAFRQNRETELDRLYDPDDLRFKSVLAAAGDETQGNFKETAGSLAQGGGFMDWLKNTVPVAKHRSDLNEAVQRRLAVLAASGFESANEIAAQFAAPDSKLKVSDVIVSFATGGRIQRADALVIDNGERFITGHTVAFDRSFVPLTARLLKNARIPQLVVIFKPVSVFDSKMPPEAVSYYQDAVAFLDRENIAYVDFIADPSLTRDLYAKGDHYTGDGMAYVTAKIVETLRAKGLVE